MVDINLLINFFYIFSALLFIIGLKMLTSLSTARKGNIISSIGMLMAIFVTLLERGIIDYKWILIGIFIGTLIGFTVAKVVEMTKIPEMVAIFNGFGGFSSMLVAWAALYPELKSLAINPGNQSYYINTNVMIATIILSMFIGGITFTGSLVAYGKLSEIIFISFQFRAFYKFYQFHGVPFIFNSTRNNAGYSYRRCGHAGSYITSKFILWSCCLCYRFCFE